jgi:hypothetical protein
MLRRDLVNTKALLTASALFMAALGLAASFAPGEVIAQVQGSPTVVLLLLVQVAGAVYLGFAMLNWMWRDNLIGGIYGRPVAVGNLTHFMVAAIALSKAALAGKGGKVVLIGSVAYSLFAVLFAVVVFGSPAKVSPAVPSTEQ